MNPVTLIDSKILWRMSKNTLMPETDDCKIISSEYCYMSDHRLLKRVSVIFRATKYTEERLHHYPWHCISRGVGEMMAGTKRLMLKQGGYIDMEKQA